MSSELIERINAEIARQRQTRADILDYGTPDPLLVEAATTIAALQAELAEAREVPGRIVDWLREGITQGAKMPSAIATAIEARDWSKP